MQQWVIEIARPGPDDESETIETGTAVTYVLDLEIDVDWWEAPDSVGFERHRDGFWLRFMDYDYNYDDNNEIDDGCDDDDDDDHESGDDVAPVRIRPPLHRHR